MQIDHSIQRVFLYGAFFIIMLGATTLIGNQLNLPPTRAVAALCVILAPFCYGGGYWFDQPWFKRIGIALLIVGNLMWIVSLDLFF